ncbi:uncharacterized protein LOC112567766 [Pomacea canaliculata]|uniref:uncharacterized protein LOC112567766 n=1 Tax=Pomacea canaliculata TaxID=400727 RepID=UPI000D7318F6|nr:uncharacterized protein LOC112567766 [Pomacea canaliculata]
MPGRLFLTLSGTSFTSDSPSQATQSNDSNVKTPVAVILGSLFGAALLVLLILGSVFIVCKRRKRYTDHITYNHGNSSLPSMTMSSRAPHPLPLSDITSSFQVTEDGMAGKIFSVEADTATTFPSAYRALTTQVKSSKIMPSRSTYRDVDVDNRFAPQMRTIADTTRRIPASKACVESSASDVYSQVNSSARQFSILASDSVHKDSNERGTRSLGGLKSNSDFFDPLYSRVVKVSSCHNNPTSTNMPDYVNVPARSSFESLCRMSSKDLYSKVNKLPAKLSSSTMTDSQSTASQHVPPFSSNRGRGGLFSSP